MLNDSVGAKGRGGGGGGGHLLMFRFGEGRCVKCAVTESGERS